MPLIDKFDVTPIEDNVRAAIKKAFDDGIYGMSLDNLFQVTSTRGVNVPPGRYLEFFTKVAFYAADETKFQILPDKPQ